MFQTNTIAMPGWSCCVWPETCFGLWSKTSNGKLRVTHTELFGNAFPLASRLAISRVLRLSYLTREKRILQWANSVMSSLRMSSFEYHTNHVSCIGTDMIEAKPSWTTSFKIWQTFHQCENIKYREALWREGLSLHYAVILFIYFFDIEKDIPVWIFFLPYQSRLPVTHTLCIWATTKWHWSRIHPSWETRFKSFHSFPFCCFLWTMIFSIILTLQTHPSLIDADFRVDAREGLHV